MNARFPRLCVLVIGLGLTSVGLAALPETDAAIEQQIRQLGSTKFWQREAATTALDAVGEPALAALRKACASEDAEISRRAAELVTRIERRVETARLLAPRRLRLAYRDTPLLEAVTDLARKTGLPLEVQGDRSKLVGRTVTLETADVSVWDALDQFLQAAGLNEQASPTASTAKNRERIWEAQNGVLIQGRVVITSGYLDSRSLHDNRMLLGEGKAPARPTHDAGAVRIRAIPQASGTPAPAGQGELPLALEVLAQPHLPWHGVCDLRIDRAVDEFGQEHGQVGSSVFPYSPELQWARNGAIFIAQPELMMPGPANRLVPLRLQSAAKPARMLRELRGTVAAQVEVGPEPLLTVDDVYQAQGRTFTAADGATLKLLTATKDDSGKIRVRLELLTQPVIMVGGGVRMRNGGRGFPIGLPGGRGTTAEELPLTLLDPVGQRVPLGGLDSPQMVNAFGMPQDLVLTFQPGPGQAGAARLVYTGRRTVILDIPFVLKDVPLP